MSVIHTLLGAQPPARTDGIAWNRVRIEHASSPSGSWSTDATQELSPLDTDPESPVSRNFTFSSGAEEAYYRLTFLDADDAESIPTDPVFDNGSGIDWRPTVEQIATILRARTYADGAAESASGEEVGTFDETTRPTRAQVEEQIDLYVPGIVNSVAQSFPDTLKSSAQRVCAVGTAAEVERSYLPEQAEEGAAVFQSLRLTAKEEVAQLQRNMQTVVLTNRLKANAEEEAASAG